MVITTCPSCGNTISADQIKCSKCGYLRKEVGHNCCTNRLCTDYMKAVPFSLDICPSCQMPTAVRQIVLELT